MSGGFQKAAQQQQRQQQQHSGLGNGSTDAGVENLKQYQLYTKCDGSVLKIKILNIHSWNHSFSKIENLRHITGSPPAPLERYDKFMANMAL